MKKQKRPTAEEPVTYGEGKKGKKGQNRWQKSASKRDSKLEGVRIKHRMAYTLQTEQKQWYIRAEKEPHRQTQPDCLNPSTI